MLFKEDLFSMLEAILFVSVEPLDKVKIMEVLGLKEEELDTLLVEYQELLALPGRGLELQHVAGGYKLATKKIYSKLVEKIIKPQGGRLSKAALETLSIIAYKQPITRSEVEKIRGVSADSMVYKLLERELITEVGRKDVPGHPNLYGTTDKFLIQLGINSIDDLPPLEEDVDTLSEEELELSNKSLEMEIVNKDIGSDSND